MVSSMHQPVGKYTIWKYCPCAQCSQDASTMSSVSREAAPQWYGQVCIELKGNAYLSHYPGLDGLDNMGEK